jgi:hypothetical protein
MLFDMLGYKDAPEPIDARNLNQASVKMNVIFAQKSKIVIFLFVPLAAINNIFLFKKEKLNLSEHSIIAGIILLGMLLISAL